MELTVEVSCEMRRPNLRPTIVNEHNENARISLIDTRAHTLSFSLIIYLLVGFHIFLQPQGSMEWLQHVQPPHDTPIHTKPYI